MRARGFRLIIPARAAAVLQAGRESARRPAHWLVATCRSPATRSGREGRVRRHHPGCPAARELTADPVTGSIRPCRMRPVRAAMMDEMIRTPYGQMPAYVAAPPAAGPWPGVVVIHDFAGMSHDLRNQADWLAGEGYLAAAPDLYYWGSPLRCLRTIIRELAAGAGRTFDDIDSIRGWPLRAWEPGALSGHDALQRAAPPLVSRSRRDAPAAATGLARMPRAASLLVRSIPACRVAPVRALRIHPRTARRADRGKALARPSAPGALPARMPRSTIMAVIAHVPQVCRATTHATNNRPRSLHAEHGALQRSAWTQLRPRRRGRHVEMPAAADFTPRRSAPLLGHQGAPGLLGPGHARE